MLRQHAKLPARGQVPDLGGLVGTCRRKEIARRREGKVEHTTGVPSQALNMSTLSPVPDVDLPVVTACCQSSILAEDE